MSLALVPCTALAAGGKLYWSDSIADKIQRADTDGSGIEDILSIDNPGPIELDLDGGKMYWVSGYPLEGLHRIHRAGLDGSNPETIHEIGNDMYGLALDLSAGKLYYTVYDCPGNSKILRSDLDGANVEEIVTGRDRILKVDLDVADDLMLWSGGDACSQDDPGFDGRIYRATLDGGDIQSFLFAGASALALDTAQDVVYWVSVTDCVPCASYHRAAYDGSGEETLIVDWYGTPDFGLDVSAGTMYLGWGPWIWRANLDGTNLTELLDDLGAVSGIALDPSGGAVPAGSPSTAVVAVLILLACDSILLHRRRRRLRH